METKETEHLPDVRNKMTAVEWMEKELDFLYHHMSQDDIKWFFDKAKQMEKEQNREFYNEGKDFSSYTYDEQYGGVEYWDREPLGFEEYYNENYGK